jgi:hypothetical protein
MVVAIEQYTYAMLCDAAGKFPSVLTIHNQSAD